MKTYIVSIPRYEADYIFGPIRDKLDYVQLVAKASKVLLLNLEFNRKSANGILCLKKDKMSRLFCYQESRVFSVAFPFNVEIENDQVVRIFTPKGLEVNNERIAYLNSILINDSYNLRDSIAYCFLEATNEDLCGFELLEEVMMMEPGYIRYDFDEINENGRFHPLNHLDINYSQYSNFKIGLYEPIDQSFFEDMLNLKTECAFIEHPKHRGKPTK